METCFVFCDGNALTLVLFQTLLVGMGAYHANAYSDFELLKSDVACKSQDTSLGMFNILEDCARACQKRFFLA